MGDEIDDLFGARPVEGTPRSLTLAVVGAPARRYADAGEDDPAKAGMARRLVAARPRRLPES